MKRFKKLITSLGLFVISICAAFLIYMTLFRWADYAICIPAMAEKVDVSPTLDGIESYLSKTATPGVKKVKVLEVLSKLGPVDIAFQSVIFPSNELRDTIFIKSCMHPLNDLEIFAIYDNNGKLVSISLLNNKD